VNDSDEPDPDPDPDTEAAPTAGRSSNPAVYASNWRTVLAVDAAMGAAVVVAGVIAAVAWNLVAGGLLGSLGVAYVAAVVRRGRRWAELRRAAGLGD
jgi:hypothetical protein